MCQRLETDLVRDLTHARFGFKSRFFAFSPITNVILARILVLFVVVGVLEILALTS
jgi:hypothetical protein